MEFEHAIFTAVFCVLVGLIYERYTNRNPVWIMWFAMLIPDADFVVQIVWEAVFPLKFSPITHGDFHNVFFLIVFALFIGWYIWKHTNIRFDDATLCIVLGFTAHLAEDALVNGKVYHFYIPLSHQGWYQGFILKPLDDIVFAHNVIGSTNITAIGILLLILAVMIRGNIQGYDWLKKYNFVPFISNAIQPYLQTTAQTTVKTMNVMKSTMIYGWLTNELALYWDN